MNKQETVIEIDLTPNEMIYLVRSNPYGRAKTNSAGMARTLMQIGFKRCTKLDWQEAGKRKKV